MTDERRNLMVAIFVLLGLVGLGWLIMKFGELPTLMSRYDAHEITIYFPQAAGIGESTEVLFCGYPVGKVLTVNPPVLLSDLDDPERKYHQVLVVVAISRDYAIPRNATPKVFRRGLGGNFVELVLEEPAVAELLTEGDKIKGYVAESSEFISEKTQRKLDGLLSSLTSLSDTLQVQFAARPPSMIDQADANELQPNIATVVMRMDETVRNLNIFLGDSKNQRHVHEALANFAAFSLELRAAVEKMEALTAHADHLLEQATATVSHLEKNAGTVTSTFQDTAVAAQEVADELALTLRQVNEVTARIAQGDGTAERLLNDPRLYESLVDTSDNLRITLEQLHQLLEEWRQEGPRVKVNLSLWPWKKEKDTSPESGSAK